MSALRVARGYTDRELIVKFDGCYHGHVDSLLVQAGSGVATFGLPDSVGIPRDFAKWTISLPYNDPQMLSDVFRERGDQIAAVIVEPVAGNMGCVAPSLEFIRACRELTTRYGALLIFDEVITGFRFHFGGVQSLFGIEPDMTILGKIIGGGMPMGAYGGRADVMAYVAPAGPVYQAGTLSGNPVAVAAGLTTLKYLRDHPEVYERLESLATKLTEEKYPGIHISRFGSMFTYFFTEEPVRDYASAKKANTDRFAQFFHYLLEHGIYFPPSQFECCFLSAAHTEEDVTRTREAIRSFFAENKQ